LEIDMNFLLRYLVLVLVGTSVALYGMAWVWGLSTELAVLAASVWTVGVVWVLERYRPFRSSWRSHPTDWKTDLASAGVIIGLVDPLLKALAPLAMVGWYARLDAAPLSDWGWGAQTLLVLLWAELAKYGSHRLHHAWAPLWWLHAMHHSSTRLYVVNGLRFHPLNYVLNVAVAVLPLMLLGVSPEALLAYLALTQPVVLMQHANIDVRHGWLNRVFSTPEVHRWHHSTQASEANCNFGNALLLWDHVFRTYRPAQGFGDRRQVGLFDASARAYPASQGYVRQLVSMGKAPCCRG
jgi:sterol desaturase/sphingolipid hydroxylase (fatty acid hydroxylase superfamily)